jgi:PAS domain S-box-containing protein
VRINPASERINGIRASDVVGHTMDEVLKDGLVDRSVTMEVLKTKTVVNMFQQTREGRKLMVTGNPVFDGRGNVTRVVINERDITEIDRLREELEQQEAISDRMRQQMLHMQLEEVESRRIVARSPGMTNILRQALKVSAVDSSVLILGESGTGKGLIADVIHKYSTRAGNPMIKINCGAIPETLVESELFGYERGAFTGAERTGKPGHVELAHRGILFLDEIAELPLASQVKLLRFLEDGRATRVGGTVSRNLDVRILAATNRDLEALVEERLFRRDLYYRLNVIPIVIPPLRERSEDIPALIQHFLEHFSARTGAPKSMTGAVLDALLAYSYPGNVRELMNLCERLVVLSEGPRIDLQDLPALIAEKSRQDNPFQEPSDQGGTLHEMLEAYEKAILTKTLTDHKGQQSIAAALGVNQSTIARKLRKHGFSS